MTTSNTIQYISALLNDPQTVTNADIEKFQSLTEAYPYFLPARYIGAAYMQKNDPFGPKMMTSMQLYAANWILFCEFVNKVAENPNKQWGITPSETTAPKRVTDSVAPTILSEPGTSQIDSNNIRKTDETEVIKEGLVAEGKKTTDDPARNKMNDLIEKFSSTVIPPYEKDVTQEIANSDESVEMHVTTESGEQDDEAMGKTTLSLTIEEINDAKDDLIQPIYTEDYFLHQGLPVSNEIPEDIEEPDYIAPLKGIDKSLMVVMSFSDWLKYFKSKTEKEKSETADKKALKTMWQKEKLAAATGEENEEIPEGVFEMAVNSITMEEGLISEALAEIHEKQGKYDKAIDMYKKLSLRNPQKNTYFAAKIEALLKERNS